MTAVIGVAAFLLFLAMPQACLAASARELNESGKLAYERGNFLEAERLFGEAVAAAPGEALFLYHRGAALVRLGRLADARSAYERALALKPPLPLSATVEAALRQLGADRPPSQRRARTDQSDAVPLDARGGIWVTEVTLNETHQARFVVDTGATACTISPALAERLGLIIPADAPVVHVMTMNGPTVGRLVSIASIRVGNVEAVNVRAVVHPFDIGVDGLLGNTFLARYAVTLDPHRRLLHLRPRQ